jgi:hypothetical protein
MGQYLDHKKTEVKALRFWNRNQQAIWIALEHVLFQNANQKKQKVEVGKGSQFSRSSS